MVDADLKSYFDTIPHGQLMDGGREDRRRSCAGADPSLPETGSDGGRRNGRPEAGTPQGAVSVPLLANIYLDPLDHLMAEPGIEMVRYADDFVILCQSEAEARQALELVRAMDGASTD